MLFFLAVDAMKAQYDPSYSHYFSMEPSFNPASVGKENQLNVVGAYALDFAGFEHNPNTFYVGADMPLYFLKNYHGVGASIMNDKIGLFTHQRIAGQYAFRFNLLGGRLAAGVQAGLIMETFDGSKLDVEQSNDPALPSSQVTGNSLDLGFGLYYTHKNWYAGLSAQHLTGPTIDLGETKEIKGWYVLHAGLEDLDYITKEFCLQVKTDKDSDWQTVDSVSDNLSLETNRLLDHPVKARYVRLFITKPDQSEGHVARIYEFAVQ